MSESTTYLLATDGSDAAQAAEDYLARTAEPSTAKIIVVAAFDLSVLLGGYDFSSPRIESLTKEDLPGKLRTKMNELVTSSAERLEEVGFDVTTQVIEGTPKQEIVALADEQDVDSIVMGRSGAGAVSELLLGSTSSYVVHHANCPVTLVPKTA